MSSSVNESSTSANAKGQPTAGQSNSGTEGTFSILPHPATTNDPQDLQRKREPGGGLQTSDPLAPHHAHGPVIPTREMLQNLEQPLSQDELRARAAELNK
ncbi:hypothetical protein H0H87_001897 [Tephrocybe sp. NHM501043]|nr:hypothetical protein H0H87_001897 [Tephrocybe sp. NHM501043]